MVPQNGSEINQTNQRYKAKASSSLFFWERIIIGWHCSICDCGCTYPCVHASSIQISNNCVSKDHVDSVLSSISLFFGILSPHFEPPSASLYQSATRSVFPVSPLSRYGNNETYPLFLVPNGKAHFSLIGPNLLLCQKVHAPFHVTLFFLMIHSNISKPVSVDTYSTVWCTFGISF